MAGKQCCENPPTLSSAVGAGKVQVFGGLSSYISGPEDSHCAVLLVSDIFGYEAPNLRKLADYIGAAGFFTVVPDFFAGDPYVPGLPRVDWRKNHGTDKGFEDAKPVVEAIKAKGISKVGAAGFCWGGKVVVELAKETSYIQAAVLLHPSSVTVEDIQGVKVPISVLGAEIDRTTPPEVVKQFEVFLNSRPEVDSFVKIFYGVSHGWSVRYNLDDAEAVKRADEAHADLLDWFSKHIK